MMHNKKTNIVDSDGDIIAVLRRHDPAGFVSASTLTDIEAHVMARVGRPSLIQRMEDALAEFLPDLRFGEWRLPWPVISASAVAFGLIFGMMSASVVETPMHAETHNYVLSEAMPQPWSR